MQWSYHKTLRASKSGELIVGVRLRSWALPLLLTFTPVLKELAIGPFYISFDKPHFGWF